MAPSVGLKRLSITAFRGASATFALEFEKGRTLTLIYGENGTGKTTICDAFEFLATGDVGSLVGRGMGSGLIKFFPTAGRGMDEVDVALESTAGKCSGRIVGKDVLVEPRELAPRIELLRRQQLVRLIEAMPGERYNEIKRFIDIGGVEESEEALRQLIKSLTVEQRQARALEGENLSTLQSFFETAGKPRGKNPVSWARQTLSVPVEGLDAEIAAIGALRRTYEALEALSERYRLRGEAVASARNTLEVAEAALSSAIADASHGGMETLSLLQAGQAYLHTHPETVECPLCLSKENAKGLVAAVASRLSALDVLKHANEQRRAAGQALATAEAAHRHFEADYAAARDAHIAGLSSHTWRAGLSLPGDLPPTDIAALPSWLAASRATSETWSAQEAQWRDEKKFVSVLAAAVEQYESNLGRRMELDALIPAAEEALRICVATRQSFTDSIVADIAQEVGRLYEEVHPGEGLSKIAFPLDPKKRASLDLMANFEGQTAPPQAYFSQSHLDTLGLCVFLALALRDRPEETILILDDVLGSVDEPHVERVIQMIYAVSAKFRHTIVTTHYRPWREKFRWGWLKAERPCQFVELTAWGIKEGIVVTRSIPEISRLAVLLAESPVDAQAVASKAGVILEAALDYLTQKYECAVPRRPSGAYTLGDLLPAVSGKLRGALRIERRETDAGGVTTTTVIALKPILDELERIMQARNAFGAHFKAITFDLLDSDAVGFARKVVELTDALTDPDHGWPDNGKSGSEWRNSGDTRRLHPLKKPS